MTLSDNPCSTRNCENFVGPHGARGKCPSCYFHLINSSGLPPLTRRADAGWPEDDELIELMESLKTFKGVAEACNRSKSSLRDYLVRRPELNARMRSLMPAPLSEAERASRLRAAQRNWRRANPERVKELKRSWASGRSVDVRRSQQQSTLENRRVRVALQPLLSVEEVLFAAEYETVLRADPCVYCGKSGGTVDHIVSVFDGGDDSVDNLAGACRSCNSSKRDKSLLEFLLWKLDRVS